MTYIPNPDKPNDADEIKSHISELYQCKRTGVWDMEAVMKWIKTSLPQLDDAASRMQGCIDDLFPGKLMELVKKEDEAA